MLNFFRKIRRKLANENKPVKYFMYAIGEIVLVVVGILIALQVNNWNEERKDRDAENYYLGQIIQELKSDTLMLHTLKNKLSNQIPIIESFLVVLNEDSNKRSFNEGLKSYINNVWSPNYFKSNSSTFEEMRSSGKIGLIIDKELRNRIVVLYNNIHLTALMIDENMIYLRPMVVDFTYFKGMAQHLKIQESMFSKYISDDDIFEKRKFKNEFESKVSK